MSGLLAPLAAGTYRIAYYDTELARDGPGLLLRDILSGEDAQVRAVVSVLDRLDADVLALSGIDHDARGAALNALNAALARPFPLAIGLPGNVGRPTGHDLDGDGWRGGPGDAQAWGAFAGQGALAVLSRLPLMPDGARSLGHLTWSGLPGSLAPDGTPEDLPISRSGHWILSLGPPALDLLLFHAVPPVFDGPEDRNGRRNHDELRLWRLLLDGQAGVAAPRGPIVVLGGANQDPVDGEGRKAGIRDLLADPRLTDPAPRSAGAAALHDPHHGSPAARDTVEWPPPGPGRLRVDYVLPGRDIAVSETGVFWPPPDDPMAATVARASRHRAVWIDIVLPGG